MRVQDGSRWWTTRTLTRVRQISHYLHHHYIIQQLAVRRSSLGSFHYSSLFEVKRCIVSPLLGKGGPALFDRPLPSTPRNRGLIQLLDPDSVSGGAGNLRVLPGFVQPEEGSGWQSVVES